MMKEFKEGFIIDALELLVKLERNLLLLEDKTTDIDIIEDIFRDLHSLKGASSMYGFENIGKLMHLFESVYEQIREGKINVGTDIINLSLDVVDFTARALKRKEDITGFGIEEYNKLEQQVAYVLKKSPSQTLLIEEENQPAGDSNTEKTIYAHFKTDDGFESRGIKIESIFNKLNKLGSVINIPIKKKNEKPKEWELFIVSKSPLYNIEDIFIFMMDIVSIELLAEENLFLNEEFNSVVRKNAALNQKSKLDELKKLISGKTEEKGTQKQGKGKKGIVDASNNELSYLKVASKKLDEQMDLLSELVTAKAELQLIVRQEGYKKLRKLIESVDKITNNFRKNILSVRLVEIKSLYLKLLRLVRDMSKHLEKDVEFVSNGMEIELDKNIIDSLENPISHLIRNSLDHGIEPIDERVANGKSPRAKIEFNTHRSGSDIIIEIKDDGRGMDKAKIKKKALDRGLIDENEELSDKQIYDLIFTPGFSTAQNLSEVSGRGVGMGAVKKSINQLRGDVEISSEQGKGTTVLLTLPMSLSIVDTLLVQSGKQFFSIPLPDVKKCTLLKQAELEQTVNDQLKIGDELVPYINLRDTFKINGEIPDRQKVVITKNGEQEVGLVVDKVIGEYQAVLKPFDGHVVNKQYLTGASVLADGQLTVILDTAKLIENNKLNDTKSDEKYKEEKHLPVI